MRFNKAGYTATSCGRVGRGGNARFPTCRLDGYGRTDRRTDRRTDGRTDKASYRVTCPQLKTNNDIIQPTNILTYLLINREISKIASEIQLVPGTTKE